MGVIMICDICHKNEATIHLKQIINGEKSELHICMDCAIEMGMKVGEMLGSLDIFSKFLTGFVQKSPKLFCKTCGKTLEEFYEDGKLGCADCWRTFRAELKDLLKKIQGTAQQKNIPPQQSIKTKTDVDEKIKFLKQKLKEAVEREDFEEAARLRDEIKNLSNKAEK
ncbi:MAG: UvrB/UvrC motif-containing protein [Elusimicrobia bacterium]|nr:UvrB/UvrC motif-containing protein [Elusimicrobiota bacterium]